MGIVQSCTFYAPKIEVVCNELGLGYYQLVWETTPRIEGKVKIYISESPTQFRRLIPDRVCDIGDNTTSFFLDDSYRRKFFLLVFNNEYEVITSNREIKLDGINNFRDVGGYETSNGKQIRWGMLYRSGLIGDLSRNTHIRLGNLRPYTIIDLRPHNPTARPEIDLPNIQYVRLPIEGLEMASIADRIYNNEFKRGDAVIFKQDTYRSFVDHNHTYLSELFDILANHQNYPVIIMGNYGKDRVAIATALILHLLGASQETIIQDYALSNNNLTYLFQFETGVENLSLDTQEAVTYLMNSSEENMEDLLLYITRKYGSIDVYLEEKLGVTREMRNRIRMNLLY